jgi:ABC-type Mn2+/Zn2+ transport system ATPase subunit
VSDGTAPPVERHEAHATHIGEALRVDGLGVRFGEVEALHDVSFSAGHGELIGVIGPNGAGKSTLFRAICGLVNHAGSVSIDGVECHHRLDRLGTAFIPQRNDVDPDFPITIGELVLTGRRRFHSWWRRPSPADKVAAAAALEEVGLRGLEHRSLGALSGGQGQRALLARALAQEADHLLLDEALSGVDQPTTEELFDLFRSLCDRGTTILVATHDLALARRRFDRVLAVNRTIQADGSPAEVLTSDTLDATFGSGTTASGPRGSRP